jgi:hypothetical protein
MNDEWEEDIPYKEPQYVDVDDEGNSTQRGPKAKWQSPKGNVQRMILNAVSRKYYRTRDEQSTVNEIARKSISLAEVESPYPLEWVYFCCEWAKGKRLKREWVQLKGLLSFIRDADKKQTWLDQNRSKYEHDKSWDDLASN